MDIITNYTNYLKAAGLAKSTQDIYLSEFKSYKEYFNGEDLRYISRDKIIEYLSRLYDLGYSPSKINQSINAIKFYKEKILRQKKQKYFFNRPKRKKFMPPILTPAKMREVIFSSDNLKHQALLFFIYDNGLRRSEAINLELKDLVTKCEHPHIIIRDAKQNSDRTIYITDECVRLLRKYYIEFKPERYLFEGEKPGKPYSETSLAHILKASLKRCHIPIRFRVHDLRHNFATHCLMAGTDIYHLSVVLGHKSVRTTEKYYAHLLPSHVVIRRPQIQRETVPMYAVKRAS